jgi:8-oxo-dGTP diphosphatase
MKTVLVVAAALIDTDGRVLIAQRPSNKSMAGLWEFPGGKINEGEKPENALVRELNEELGINTWRSCLAPLSFASYTYNDFHLLMPLFVCRKWEGTPTPMEGQVLKWVDKINLKNYSMPPADIPLISAIRDIL